MRNTLLELYHNYVRHEHENLPVHFDEMVTHFHCLDNFFKAIVTAQLNALHSKAPVGELHQ